MPDEQRWFQRLSRRERLQRDIDRARSSRVPTWAYAVALVAVLVLVYLLLAAGPA